MKQAICPEVDRAFPGVRLQRWRVLNDEEGSGVQPDKRGETGQHAEKRDGGVRLSLRILQSYRRGRRRLCGTQSYTDSGEAQQACRCRLHLRGSGEEWGKVADKIADAGSQAHKQERKPIARPLTQVCHQCDGEQAEPGADQQRNSDARGGAERKKRKKCRRARNTESNAEPQVRRGPEAQPRRKQAEKNSTDGHGGHHGGQVRAGYAEARQPLEKRELREDEEVDGRDRDKAGALPSGGTPVTPQRWVGIPC